MNVNDSQIASKILSNHNYEIVKKLSSAEVVLIMTCSIREGIKKRLLNDFFKNLISLNSLIYLIN